MTADEQARITEVVSALCELPGPTGYEHLVRDWLKVAWGRHTDDIEVDAVGNLIAHIGAAKRRSVLLDAHMDEIGFKVRYVTDDGFLMLANAQSSQTKPQQSRHMIGQPAQIVTADGVLAHGVFAAPSGHVGALEPKADGNILISDFFVDLGLASREQVDAQGIHPGAAVIFAAKPRTLGNRLVAKAMDDRLLLAVITLLLDALDGSALAADLWLSATIQEENGVHGARALASTKRFDAAVALDVGLTADTPVIAPNQLPTRLGGGPVIVHSDQFVNYNPQLTSGLLDTARRHGIPHQQATFGQYGSNGVAFQDAGIPTALIGTPIRYPHTAFEMADIDDIRATVTLLQAYLTRT
jgi:putative aminopeptidase FrvX